MNCAFHRAFITEPEYLNSLSWIERQWMLIKCGGLDLFTGLFALAVPIFVIYVAWRVGRFALTQYKKNPKATAGFVVGVILFSPLSIVFYAVALLFGTFAVARSFGITTEVIDSWPGPLSTLLALITFVGSCWCGYKIVDIGSRALERWSGEKPDG